MPLVSIEQARAHLRVSGDYDDASIALYLGAAEQAAADYLQRAVYPDVDSLAAAVLAGDAGADPIVANDAIRAAVLLTLGRLYALREDVIVGVPAVEMPLGARSLLMPHRTRLGI